VKSILYINYTTNIYKRNSNNLPREYTKQNLSKDMINPEFSFFNMYKELRKLIDSLNQTIVLKPLNSITHSK